MKAYRSQDMTPNRICIVFNPAARKLRWPSAVRLLNGLPNVGAMLAVSPKERAETLAREAVEHGFDVVVAAGGDGTVNGVANGLRETDAALGVLPLGTVNVFARELEIPMKMDAAWDVILRGNTRKIDAVEAVVGKNGAKTEKIFVQLAGVGLDARAVAAVSERSKSRFGVLSYVAATVRVAARNQPLLRARCDDGGTAQGAMVLIGNGKFYGGAFAFFPQAAMDDGLLDICVFENQGYLRYFRYAQAALRGAHVTLPDVKYFRVAQVRVEPMDEAVAPVQVDGELAGETPVEFRAQPRAVKVLVP
jgi:diacylglycerol kinase (ATP)